MTRHHEVLLQQFQQLTDVRNELKQAIDTAESTSQDTKKSPHLLIINQWERDNIQRIQQTAAECRKNIQEKMAVNLTEVRAQLDLISKRMQLQFKEGNYMEYDVAEVKNQLEQLKDAIEHLNEKIQLKISNNMDWSKLICVGKDSTSAEHDIGVMREPTSTYPFERKNRLDNDPSSTARRRLTKNYSDRCAVPTYCEPEPLPISTTDRSDQNPHSGSPSRDRPRNLVARRIAEFYGSRESVNDRLSSSGHDILPEQAEESTSRLSDRASYRTQQNCKQQ